KKSVFFINKPGLNTQMIHGLAWSRLGELVKQKKKKKKKGEGVNISVTGCISHFSTINFSDVESLKQNDVDKLEKTFSLIK
ncbi:uncharacterized protein BX663DRAFT_421251, partial [Cokeromyces recurvatus]|uniref:uncharacterized protein n=1 Tax=Cokeromyces recurvatus TaxID=90255 RepID=UPI0022202061